MIRVKCLAQCLAQSGSAPHAGFAADISKELEYLPLIFLLFSNCHRNQISGSLAAWIHKF